MGRMPAFAIGVVGPITAVNALVPPTNSLPVVRVNVRPVEPEARPITRRSLDWLPVHFGASKVESCRFIRLARFSQTGKLPRFRCACLRTHKRVNPREHRPMDMRCRHSAFCNARYSVIYGRARPIIIRDIVDKDFKPIIPMMSDFDCVRNWRPARRKINNLGHLCRHILRRSAEHFHLEPRFRSIAASPARHNAPFGNENH